MEKASVVIIGGGATGVGILRDLSMRGVEALLVEKGDLVNGASSRFHGLLHSGARYAVKDQEAAAECIRENEILRRIGEGCVEPYGGMFARLDTDEEAYEEAWTEGCKKSGIAIKPLTIEEAFRMEPHLSKRIVSAYLVPDGAIDGFRMAWQNVDSAKRYGGRFKTYTEVIEIKKSGDHVQGVIVQDVFTGEKYAIACDMVVNAAGGWAGKIARLADLSVGVQPDKGALIAFNRRIVNHVVNRLHKSSDGDIFVPHGPITILGTSSMSVDDPEITEVSRSEVENLLAVGKELLEGISDARILRAFAGSRPLYMPPGGEKGRGASRGFAIIDHEKEGLFGMMTIVGGKFTTYRLMAEKISDEICAKFGNKTPCRTAMEPLMPQAPENLKRAAGKFFPSFGTELAARRLGAEAFARVADNLAKQPSKRKILCECENVTLAEVEEVASDPMCHSLDDLRRRTRVGMGTCQGSFCAYRIAAAFAGLSSVKNAGDTLSNIKKFLEGRYKGMRPVLFGRTLREAELMRGLYSVSLSINGGQIHEPV